ncbi:MAG: redoxin domain-containing protein, partial [Candidatus Latescibacteria bacterium]|nr:redoxin domain-containing protein [Candidatus Latescibacterota bacterium]
PLSYARMLTKIAEYLPKWTVETELAAGILFSKGSFLRRIETILSDKRDHIRRLSRWAMIGITSAMFISLIMALILPLGETRETGNMVTLSGKVVYKGEPVPDTDIYLNNIILRNVEKVCKTDRKGSFTFEVDSSKLGGRNNYEYYFITPSVIAHNKKYSLGWANLVKGTAYNNLIIHLHEQKKAGGIVTDSSGKPLEGAEIIPYEVYNGNHGVRFSYDHPLITKTDKTGKFHLHNIPNGGYGRFFVRKEGYAQKQIKQLTEFINNRPITLEPEVLIKGRIIFEDTGSPAKNVRVRAVQTITPMWTFETVTNKNGYYTLTNLPSGKFNVYPVFNEAFPEWTAVTNDNVYVKSGEVVENINIKLIKGGVITGRVIAKDTGKPIPNHWIGYNDHSRAENFDSLISMYYTETDADGTFNIRSSPGAGRIITSAPDEYKQEYDERNINKNWVTRSINAVEGETVEAEDIQFERGITVYGTIRMLNGEPVAGVPITNKGRQLAYQSDSEEDGSFIVTGLREGVELSLKAFHPKLMLLGDITFEVQADTTVSILLEKYETTSISGRVIDSEENPMSKAYVMLFINDKLKKTISPWNMISSTLTDDKGAYTFDGLIVGEQYGLDVRVHEYVNLQSFGTLIAKRNMPGHDDIILSKGNRWLEGTVTNTDGIPIEDATVQIRITGSYKYARTDVNGQYRYDNLIKVCTDLALVTHKEYGLFQFRYIPTNSRKNFVLTKGMHYLSGKIVNTEGNPLAGAFLSLEPEIHNSGKYSLRSKTDKNGKFTLENLIEKNVTILVGHEDIGFKTFKNIETDRENVTFELVSDEAAEKASEPGFQFSEKGVVILEDKPAPKLDIERWINGKDIKLADLKGNIIVLYFLSLDIGKCRDIYRFIRILEGEYNDDGVVFIGIHEYTAEIDPLKKLINEKVNTFNIAVDKKSNKKDSKGVTFQNYGISMIPMSFVIDSEGNVHTDIPGVNLENKIKEYIKARKG